MIGKQPAVRRSESIACGGCDGGDGGDDGGGGGAPHSSRSPPREARARAAAGDSLRRTVANEPARAIKSFCCARSKERFDERRRRVTRHAPRATADVRGRGRGRAVARARAARTSAKLARDAVPTDESSSKSSSSSASRSEPLLWPRPRDDRGGRSRAGSTGASRPRAGPESVETTSHAMGAQNSQPAAAAARDARESARA